MPNPVLLGLPRRGELRMVFEAIYYFWQRSTLRKNKEKKLQACRKYYRCRKYNTYQLFQGSAFSEKLETKLLITGQFYPFSVFFVSRFH